MYRRSISALLLTLLLLSGYSQEAVRTPAVLSSITESPVIYDFSFLSQINQVLEEQPINRLIEPTSPILGNKLVSFIRTKAAHPQDIYDEIIQHKEELDASIIVSSAAYYKTLLPELDCYCSDTNVSTVPPTEAGWSVTEPSAIPFEVLKPLHGIYTDNVRTFKKLLEDKGYYTTQLAALALVDKYQRKKESCRTVKRLYEFEEKAKKIIPKEFHKLIELNAKISHPEAAFPRAQFSINGYTHHIYDELVSMEDLYSVLRIAYDAQVAWLKQTESGTMFLPMFTFVEQHVLKAGYSAKDALLVLCYSTRRMPSIDVHYLEQPYRALALETYFWKFKEINEYVMTRHLGNVFPNHMFKINPGLYHYMTASYLAYEVRMEGYSGPISVFSALVSKVGYKFHKLVFGLNEDNSGETKLERMLDLVQEQGTLSGIEAGVFGGMHGRRLAREERKRNRRISNGRPVVYKGPLE